MFSISAPHPTLQTRTTLPNPSLSDSVMPVGESQIVRAMDGTRYTYIKKKAGRQRFHWDFVLSRPKAIELREFFKSYHSAIIQIEDHHGDQHIGHFITNPFVSEGSSRAAPALQSLPGERYQVSLEFEASVSTPIPPIIPAITLDLTISHDLSLSDSLTETFVPFDSLLDENGDPLQNENNQAITTG